MSVNTVAKEQVLIQKAQTNFYWANITDEALDELSKKIAPLMKFIDSLNSPLPPMELNLKDELRKKRNSEF